MLTLAELINPEKPLSFKERLEGLLHSWDHRSRYVKKNVYKDHNVLCVIRTPDTGEILKQFADPDFESIERIEEIDADGSIYNLIKKKLRGMNLVTDIGDEFYADEAASGTSTNDFKAATGRQELGNGAQGTPNKTNTYSALIGPVTASRKIIDATYPLVNDGDADNTSAAIDTVTWLTSWTKADFNATGLTGGVIHNAGASPVGGSVLLTYWTITAFNKTADDTLKVFINHNFLGV